MECHYEGFLAVAQVDDLPKLFVRWQGFRFKGGMDACTEGIWIWLGALERAKTKVEF